MSKNYGALCLVFLSLAFSNAQGQTGQTAQAGQTAQPTPADDSISIQGEVLHPTVLKASDLAAMKRLTVTVKDEAGHEQTYSGVALSDILGQAGVTLGKALRGENMSKYLLVKSGDGYEVLFSLPELDSSFSDKTIFLADQLNGQPLPAGKGPFRIVVPGEKKHARWIWEVRTLTIGFAKE